MSANSPVPPPPPPPSGGAPASRHGAHRDVAPSTQALPPTFAPTGSPAAGIPAAPAPVSWTEAPTQVGVAPVPPQRVRYATEPGYGAPSPVGWFGQQGPAAAGGPGPVRPAYHPPASAAPATVAATVAAPAAVTRTAASPGVGPTGAMPPAAAQRSAGPAVGRAAPERGATSGGRPPGGGSRSGGGSGGSRSSGGGRASRRLGAGWIAFIVVDVLLVIGAIVFAVSLAGGDDTPPPVTQSTAPPASSTTDEASEEPAEPTESATFASESRNITCEMTDLSVTCSIAQLANQPAPVDGCDGTVGYRVTLQDGAVEQPCVPAGEKPGPASDDVALLNYGTSKTLGDFTCDSEKTGMTCRDDSTGKGFTIARAGIRTL